MKLSARDDLHLRNSAISQRATRNEDPDLVTLQRPDFSFFAVMPRAHFLLPLHRLGLEDTDPRP